MEKTLIILKPDCFGKCKVGATITRFEDAGFRIVAMKMAQLTDELLNEHYSHINHLSFFPQISDFMKSSPVLIMILEGEGVIKRCRYLIGPTDSHAAPAGTIRGDWGSDKMRNIIHASDGPENAKMEIRRFFAADEIFG